MLTIILTSIFKGLAELALILATLVFFYCIIWTAIVVIEFLVCQVYNVASWWDDTLVAAIERYKQTRLRLRIEQRGGTGKKAR